MASKKFKRQKREKSVESHTSMVEKKVENAIKENSKITKTEKEIYRLLIIENLTISQIVDRRKTSDKAVYKIIKNLQRKGIIKRGKYTPNFLTDVLQTPDQKKDFINLLFRYHGNEYNISILEKSQFYEKLRKRKNLIYLEGNTIRLYEKSLEIYQNQSESFIGATVQEAVSKAQNYFTRLFWKLEDRLRITIIKGQGSRIKQVRGHLSEINNELAREYNKRKLIFKVFGTKDNKLWFHIDNSFNLNEAEAVHGERHKEDMERVQQFFNDIRDNEIMLPSQISAAVGEILNFNKEYAENFKSHVAAINTLSASVRELNEIIKEMRKRG